MTHAHGPAERLRAELVIAQEKLYGLRREADEALDAGPLSAGRAAGLEMRLEAVTASVRRIRREIRALRDASG
jgi:hypothetical protein